MGAFLLFTLLYSFQANAANLYEILYVRVNGPESQLHIDYVAASTEDEAKTLDGIVPTDTFVSVKQIYPSDDGLTRFLPGKECTNATIPNPLPSIQPSPIPVPTMPPLPPLKPIVVPPPPSHDDDDEGDGGDRSRDLH